MLSAILLFAVIFSETKVLSVQIILDRLGYSCNTIDGCWGTKSASALARYCADRSIAVPASPDEAYDNLFADEADDLLRIDAVTAAEIASCVTIPRDAAGKAALTRMNYESIPEMYAERGHLSRRAFERLNPGIVWQSLQPGTKLVVPNFPTIESVIAAAERPRRTKTPPPVATLLRVSLARFEITAYDANGKLLALLPCSIARDKAKIPQGELKIVSRIPWPNYTYTPDRALAGAKATRHIFPEGPNTPVGAVWMGLSLPGFGIHGTPSPETIGRAESHGCFRLSNWNAARLFALTRIGTVVIVEN